MDLVSSMIFGEYLNKRMQLFNLKKYTLIKKRAIYKLLYGTYKLNDFISLLSMLYNNSLICYNVIKTIEDEKEIFRDKVFEEKLLNFLELYLQPLKNIEPSDFEKFLIRYINSRKININLNDFIKQANKVIDILYKFDSKITDDISKYDYRVYDAISTYLAEFTYPEERNCDFRTCFKEELDIDLRDFKCDFYDKALEDFGVVIPPIDGNIEFQLSNERLSSYKKILGDKLGNKIFGINKYCINHSAVFDDAESLFSSGKEEPLFYIITQLIKALNLLIMETDNDKREYFINNNFKDFLELSIYDCLHGCNILFDFLDIVNPIQYIKDYMISIFKNTKSSKVKLNLLELYDNFKQDNFKIIDRDFFQYLPYEELQEYCFKNKINLFIKYFCGSDLLLADINIIKNNIFVLNNTEDVIVLNDVLNVCKRIKGNLEFCIRRELGRLPHKQLISILQQLNREQNHFKLNIVNAYDIELFKNITQAINNVKRFNVVTKTSNALKDLLNEMHDKLDTFSKINIWECGVDVYNDYETCIELEEYIEDRLFNLMYKEQIDQIRLESEQQFEKYKKELEQKSQYDRKIYYDNFINNLLNNTKQENEIYIDDFETIKDEFLLKYNEIISNYQTEEIRDCFATNEYMYNSMKNQNIEKTPLFVCFLKGVEQFLCAYINYLVLKDTKLQDSRDNAKYIRIKAMNNQKFLITSKTNWNELKATGGDLVDYINKRFELNIDILQIALTEKFKEKTDKWLNSARNGNLHKDNIYLDYKVKEYIKYCYSVITYAILVLII